MAVTTQHPQQAQLVQPTSRPTKRRQTTKKRRINKKAAKGSLLSASLKASLFGGTGALILIALSLIPYQILAFLVIPGFLVVWLSTGMLAGIIAGDHVQNTMQGGKVGWMAGFWTGIYSGIAAMILAAFGVFLYNFGENVALQFPPEQLPFSFLTPSAIATMARVLLALVLYGFVGSLISGMFASFGGMIYPKLAITE